MSWNRLAFPLKRATSIRCISLPWKKCSTKGRLKNVPLHSWNKFGSSQITVSRLRSWTDTRLDCYCSP
ncbi:unnamed protein product [Ixodes pacificus]